MRGLVSWMLDCQDLRKKPGSYENIASSNEASRKKPGWVFSRLARAGVLVRSAKLRLNYGDENILSVRVNFQIFSFINLNNFAGTIDDEGDALGIIAFLDIVSFGNRAINIC